MLRAAPATTFRLYHVALLTAAALALAFATRGLTPADPFSLLVVFALMAFAEVSALPLPGEGYVSAGGVVDMACLLLLGPAWAAWINVAATLVVQGVVRRRPWVRVTHNMALFALTVLAAGAAFRLAGGRVGAVTLPRDLGPVLAAIAAYFVTNSVLVSTVLAIRSGTPTVRVWQRHFLTGFAHHVSPLVLGVLTAMMVRQTGPWGLVLFAVPFFLAYHSFKLYVEMRRDLKDFVRALAEVLEEVDPYTRQHSVRVARYAVQLGRAFRLSERDIDDLEYAALVHDLGKIGPQNQHILQKPGALTREEQRTLRSHPAAGAQIVVKVRALRRASDIVRLHHERPDGNGYPYGLTTPEIPVGARILNVADAFDAMTSDRPYRKALAARRALDEISRGAGSQFDPEVVQCLLGLHRDGRFEVIPSPSSDELRALKVQPSRVGA
ncbi:MAG: HD-GYP domain-containing protein [Candidatus Eisenbacteria bacterium]